jgi:hypothetical protein
MPPGSMTVAEQTSDAEQTPYEDQPEFGDDGAARADQGPPPQAGQDGADEIQPPPDVRQDRGRPSARGDYDDRANPYARDPYARDPYARDPYAARGRYDDPRADPSDGGDDNRGPPPRYGRGWRESPPPDYGDDGQAPPPRYQERQPYSSADEGSRDGY